MPLCCPIVGQAEFLWRSKISNLNLFLSKDSELKNIYLYSLKPHNRWLPIHVAAEQGHLDLCKYIIERNGHYNLTLKQIGSITTTFMSTPLHFASENGHFEICKLLIEYMAHKNPATLDSDLWTPLHFAARFNHLGICRCVDFQFTICLPL